MSNLTTNRSAKSDLRRIMLKWRLARIGKPTDREPVLSYISEVKKTQKNVETGTRKLYNKFQDYCMTSFFLWIFFCVFFQKSVLRQISKRKLIKKTILTLKVHRIVSFIIYQQGE